ncbi:hypothetical protein GQ53DRAFT_766512 [Thozetella sp. PMI_491]|nr:hypothetical protein GQ53DRAFT_766512 [Thozetella sp. PMI_491]
MTDPDPDPDPGTVPAARSSQEITKTARAQSKRKRASKPKVRTGCITCKSGDSPCTPPARRANHDVSAGYRIRRVKCGEERPACLRCTSTGRVCDGYDRTSAPSRVRSQESQRAASELARREFLKAYQWSDALRTMRPIMADISGTDIEKRFFHRFRKETSDGMTAHICNFSNFWTRVAPQVSHTHEAVKHAVIALGAAHELFTFPDARDISGLPRDQVEEFMFKQYNKSIKQLTKYAGSLSLENTYVTIVCCLVFILLETLMQNHCSFPTLPFPAAWQSLIVRPLARAVTHLTNGLRILQSLPPSSFNFLAETDPWRPGLNASFDIEETARLFSRMEISASFASGIRPILCERGYSYRRSGVDAAENDRPFADLQAAHRAVCVMARDAAARLHETMGAANDPVFWADPKQVEQQHFLHIRVESMLRRLVEFQEREKPDKDSADYLYIHLDRAHMECVKMMFQFIDDSARKQGAPIPVPPEGLLRERNATTVEILKLVSLVQRCGTGKSWLRRRDEGRRSFVTDTGIRGPLYVVTIGAKNERLRERALSMLVKDGGREGFWDGQAALYAMVTKRAREMEEARSPPESDKSATSPSEARSSSSSVGAGGGGDDGDEDDSDSEFDFELADEEEADPLY